MATAAAAAAAAAAAHTMTAISFNSLSPDASLRLEASLRSRPSDGPSVGTLGKLLLHQRRDGEALFALERAVELLPRDGETAISTAWAIQRTGRGQEHLPAERAAELYSRGLRAAPAMASSAVYNNFGQALVAASRADEAEAAYGVALRLDPRSGDAYNSLASLASMRGDAAATVAAAVERLRVAGPSSASFKHLASAHRWGTRPEEERGWLAQMRELIHAPASAVQSHYALYDALRKLGRREEAWHHLSSGAALQRRHVSFDVGHFARQLEATRAAYAPLLGADGKLRPPPPTAAPAGGRPIFIVGFPRSGSTMLSQALMQAGGLRDAGEKCLYAPLHAKVSQGYAKWVADAGPAALPLAAAQVPSLWAQLGETYTREMAGRFAKPTKGWISKMLENYWHLGSIYLSLPHAKVLHMWREPVQACFSAYATLFSQGSNAVPYSYDLDDLAAYHRVYDGAMAFWREALPSHFLLTVNYTELVLSPEAALHRVVDFVGLPWDPSLYLGFHSSRGLVHTASALSVREPVHSRSLEAWKAFEDELRPLVRALED